MNRMVKLSHVVIALGLIAALALASPVFGLGGSIKKAIKKEVTKQVAGVKAPAGAPGAPGASGAPGAPGAAGSARAYGLVSSGGVITRSKNAISPVPGSTGIYCIKLDPSVDAATATVLVSPNWSDDGTFLLGADHSIVEPASNPSNCGAYPNAIEVITSKYNGDVTDNNSGGGDAAGDGLALENSGFFFMVP